MQVDSSWNFVIALVQCNTSSSGHMYSWSGLYFTLHHALAGYLVPAHEYRFSPARFILTCGLLEVRYAPTSQPARTHLLQKDSQCVEDISAANANGCQN
jgi:hypothetical protein